VTTPRYPFASPTWAAALHGYLVANGPELAQEHGADFSMCEVYTDVPAEVSDRDRVAVSWGFEGGAVWFSLEERDDVDMKVTGTWDVLAPLARLVYADDPEGAARSQAALGAALADGSLQVAMTGPRPEVLGRLHDDLARITA
jgi:hypothetical protein